MTADVELLPCPFCGSESIDPKGWASTDSAGPACDDCGAGAGGVSGTLQDNIKAWNRRAAAARDAEIEALRAEVAEWKRVASAQAELHGESEARAERLAEALRHSRWCRTCAEDGWESCEDGSKNDALLREHEEGRG